MNSQYAGEIAERIAICIVIHIAAMSFRPRNSRESSRSLVDKRLTIESIWISLESVRMQLEFGSFSLFLALLARGRPDLTGFKTSLCFVQWEGPLRVLLECRTLNGNHYIKRLSPAYHRRGISRRNIAIQWQMNRTAATLNNVTYYVFTLCDDDIRWIANAIVSVRIPFKPIHKALWGHNCGGSGNVGLIIGLWISCGIESLCGISWSFCQRELPATMAMRTKFKQIIRTIRSSNLELLN